MITDFRDERAFLSNFHPSEVELDPGDGVPLARFPTVEHAFQAAKTLSHEERLRIAALPTPAQAKRAGRRVALRADWEQVKDGTMAALVWQKFSRYPDLAELLLSTGDEELIEGNTWGDRVWGCVAKDGRWIGQNRLGKILMDVRERLSRHRNADEGILARE